MSVFVDRVIPPVCVFSLIDYNDERGPDIHQIIDGKQRLTTFISFLNNEFTVEIEGIEYYFKDLPEDFQKAYQFYSIQAYTAYDNYDYVITDQDKIEWFKQINFSGTPMDIKHLEKLDI